jgi:hypothetical protein
MHSFVRKTALATVLMLAATTAAQAQERREKELRVDLVGLESNDGTTNFGIGIPGNVALGIYLNKNIAIEPTISFNSTSGDGFSASFMQFGVFVPYYLKGDTGRSGLFISPGLLYGKAGGDLESDGTVDFGVDVGWKKPMRDNVVMRIAANVRTGDSYEDVNGDSQVAIGATFGIGVFWK